MKVSIVKCDRCGEEHAAPISGTTGWATMILAPSERLGAEDAFAYTGPNKRLDLCPRCANAVADAVADY